MSRILKIIAENTEGKFFEWAMSLMFCAVSVHVLIWPASLHSDPFKYAVLATNANVVAFWLLALATVRIAALIVNGRSTVIGPRIRAWGSLLGAVTLLQMFFSMVLNIVPSSPPSIGLPILSTLFVAELYSAFRAATDVRIDSHSNPR